MALIFETLTNKTVTRTVKTTVKREFSDVEIEQIIGNFTFSLSENAPCGNCSNYISNQELYETNKKEFNTAYRTFIEEMYADIDNTESNTES